MTGTFGRKRHAPGRHDRRRGQSLAEFALVLPLFLAMVFGIIDLGRVIWAMDDLGNAAREGARYASVHGNSDLTPCPTGPGATAQPGCPALGSDLKDPTRQAVQGFLVAPGSSIVIEVCYFDTASVGCTGNSDQSGAGNARGEYVRVTVHSTVQLFTASLLGMGPFSVNGQSTVLINN
jgi:hypothetical protein